VVRRDGLRSAREARGARRGDPRCHVQPLALVPVGTGRASIRKSPTRSSPSWRPGGCLGFSRGGPLRRKLRSPCQRTRRPSVAIPDWAEIHRDLRRPGVTLQLLWEEHRGIHPDGYRRRRCQPCLSARGIGRRAQSDPVSCRGRRKGCTERIRLHGCGGRSPSSRHGDDAGEQPGFGRRRNAAAVPDAHPGRVSLIGWAGTVTPPFDVNSGRWQQGAETAASSH
jgi:hypothetical protein